MRPKREYTACYLAPEKMLTSTLRCCARARGSISNHHRQKAEHSLKARLDSATQLQTRSTISGAFIQSHSLAEHRSGLPTLRRGGAWFAQLPIRANQAVRSEGRAPERREGEGRVGTRANLPQLVDGEGESRLVRAARGFPSATQIGCPFQIAKINHNLSLNSQVSCSEFQSLVRFSRIGTRCVETSSEY